MQLIAKPRLDAYRLFFNCGTDVELIGAYLWGQAVAGAFQPNVSMYEVVLRNAVHKHASLFASRGASDSYPWYDHTLREALPTKGKSREKIDFLLYENQRGNKVRRAVQLSPDQAIASLSFGFWPNFLQGITKLQRQKILHQVFPHYPNGSEKHWSFDANASTLFETLRKIQDLRNRIAHYEPVWKPHRLTGNERHWSQAVQSLRNEHKRILNVLEWCCPATPILYKVSSGWRSFNTICTTDAVKAHMTSPFSPYP